MTFGALPMTKRPYKASVLLAMLGDGAPAPRRHVLSPARFLEPQGNQVTQKWMVG
jgi:hypothetical protein